MRCLVTGGAGMIGAALVNHLLAETDWDVHVVDSLTYAALEGKRLAGASRNPRFSFAKQDVGEMNGTFDPNYIVHLAAETHVDRSIRNPLDFILSNVMGTYAVLQYARQQSDLKKLLYFSTDEVFGSANGEPCHEHSPYNSGNPYAASKAAGEEIALAWGNTFGIPVVVSHCSNVIGAMQHEEKFIPKLVRLISEGKTVKIHADKDGNVGSRMYVHAGDVARAIVMLLLKAEPQEKYNIPGKEISNLEMAEKVAVILGQTLVYERVYPQADRPGWDFAYRITGEKIRALGWEPSPNFDELLRKVVLECRA